MDKLELTPGADFPPVDYAAWRAKADKDLKGASFDKRLMRTTYDGTTLQPVYTLEDAPKPDASGFAGMAPYTRGARALAQTQLGWDVRQPTWHPDVDAANAALREDVAGGATSVLVQVAARGRIGVLIQDALDVERLLAGLDLGATGVNLSGAGRVALVAAMLAAHQDSQSVGAEASGCFGVDPVSALALTGELPWSTDEALALASEVAAWTISNRPRMRALTADGTPWDDAGASTGQQLGGILASAVAYLRALTGAGIELRLAARQIAFTVGVGTEMFQDIALLRALRATWARVLEACGDVDAAAAMHVTAGTSGRALTACDPWVNMLRNTAACFAGAVGGADAVVLAPHDALRGVPGELGRRVARNTQHVLGRESHLAAVVDPAGGSWFLEHLTAAVAASGWAFFQAIEGQGGVIRALESGWLRGQVDGTWQKRARNLARRVDPITGVSEFPDIGEKALEPEWPDMAELEARARLRLVFRTDAGRSDALVAVAGSAGPERFQRLVDAARLGATSDELLAALKAAGAGAKAAPLTPRRSAEGFEALRDASGAASLRPTVFLASLGPVAQHTARTTWAKNFFEAGGFATLACDGYADAEAAAAAFRDSGAHIACLCSSDKVYADRAAETIKALKAAGARDVLLAGWPGAAEDAWRAAGAGGFIYVGCDVLAILTELLTSEGVLS